MLTGCATAARLLSGFIVMKLVALQAGPEGVAQLGQFMSLTALLIVFAGGGIGPGVIKYLAEVKDDQRNVEKLLQSALSFTLLTALSMCILVLFTSHFISEWLFGNRDFQWLIVVLAIAQIFVALHNLIIAIINGLMDVKRLALIHILGSVIGIFLPLIFSVFYGFKGILLAYVLGQAALLLVSFVVYKRSGYFSFLNIKWLLEREEFLRLAHFSLMTLTSALLAPVMQIAVRNNLAIDFSWEQVGYWQAVSKVSEAYLLFITMAISVYYLPKLSFLKTRSEVMAEIKSAYLYLIPLVSFLALLIYFFRDFVVYILFSENFYAANYLFAPQLFGDVLKIASFIFSYLMLAKAMTKTFIASELFFSALYYVLVLVMTENFGLIGAMYAFVINYMFYLLFTAMVANYLVRGMDA